MVSIAINSADYFVQEVAAMMPQRGSPNHTKLPDNIEGPGGRRLASPSGRG